MARYIDADNFRKTMIKRFGCIPCLTDYSEFSKNDIPIDDALNLVHTADVAPRAEFDRVARELERVEALYFAKDTQLENTKAEVAREIFEEIEKTLNRKIARSKPQFEKLHCDEKDLSIWGYKDMGYFQGVISTCEDLLDLLDALKKKYTEGE